MKRNFKLLVAVLVLAVMVFTLASCEQIQGIVDKIVPHEHEYSADWSHDATNHWHAAICDKGEECLSATADLATHTLVEGVCSVCGYTDPNHNSGCDNHAWNAGVVTVEPTCNKEGSRLHTCLLCGATEEVPEPKIPHTEETIEGKDPTCTETGLSSGKKCSVCGETIKEQIEIGTVSHVFENGVCIFGCGTVDVVENEFKVTTYNSYGFNFGIEPEVLDSFTATEAGYYTFNIPAGLGIFSKTAYDNYSGPEVDFMENATGTSFTLYLDAEQVYEFYVGAMTEEEWFITWSYSLEKPVEPTVINLEDGDNAFTVQDVDLQNGVTAYLNVYQTALYTLKGTGLYINVYDYMGMLVTRGFEEVSISLEGSMWGAQYTIVLGSDTTGDYSINVSYVAPTWLYAGEENTIKVEGSADCIFSADYNGPHFFNVNGATVTIDGVEANADGSFTLESYTTYNVTISAETAGDYVVNVVAPTYLSQYEDNTVNVDGTIVVYFETIDKGHYTISGEGLTVVVTDTEGNVYEAGSILPGYTSYIVKITAATAGEYTVTVKYEAPLGSMDRPVAVESLPATLTPDLSSSYSNYYYSFTATANGHVTLTYTANGELGSVAIGDTYAEGVTTLTVPVLKGHTYKVYFSCGDPVTVNATLTFEAGALTEAELKDIIGNGYISFANGSNIGITQDWETGAYYIMHTQLDDEWNVIFRAYYNYTLVLNEDGSISFTLTYDEANTENEGTPAAIGSLKAVYADGEWIISCVHVAGAEADCENAQLCTICGEILVDAFGHEYVKGICSCGAKDPEYVDYYLVGWINGKDYGCEADHANLGEYKFVDGKLTVKFAQDSYVFVKTGNLNGESVKWYLFESYVDTNQGNLYENKPEKMKIPGNVEVNFTLTVNEDGSLTLSYHIHYYEAVVTAPTCTAAGYTTHTCACGDTYKDSEVASAGHKDENGDFKCDACSTKMLPADGTALTIPQALAIGKLFEKDTYSTQKYYISGIVTGLYNTQYGNFYIQDAEGNKICIYGLYSADGKTRYDAMSYKPVNGDEITVYTVLGFFSDAQGKNAWLDDVVAHEHKYVATVTAPTCLAAGYTTHTCSICDGSYTDSEVAALGHTTEAGTCERCNQEIGGSAPVIGELAKFNFGANGTASHADPNSKFSNGKSYTENGYTLKFTTATNCYDGGRDAKGNSCMKMGTSSNAGSFTVTVAENVTEVVIYVAQYKSNTTKINANGTSYTITTASNNGEYTAIKIDTSVNKTFTFATVSGGVRCMIDAIVFNGYAK